MAVYDYQLAEAVKNRLNAASWSPLSFTAERAYCPHRELPNLTDLRVVVVSASQESDTDTRAAVEVTTEIDVAIQKRVDPTDLGECDALAKLAQDIALFFLGDSWAQSLGATCVEVTREPIYDPIHLTEKRVFTAVVRLTFLHHET